MGNVMHHKACLAYALTCVIENHRDDRFITDHDFRLRAQDNFLTEADEYLDSGLVDCRCGAIRLDEALNDRRGFEDSREHWRARFELGWIDLDRYREELHFVWEDYIYRIQPKLRNARQAYNQNNTSVH